MESLPTTASLRGTTGLDSGARRAFLGLLNGSEVDAPMVLAAFLRREAYADVEDFLDGVRQVRGFEAADQVRSSAQAVIEANTDESRLDWEAARAEARRRHGPLGILLAMPDADFLSAIEAGAGLVRGFMRTVALTSGVNRICERRGLSWRMAGMGSGARFEWRGDQVLNEVVVAPALVALADPRLSKGAGVEFEGARAELRRNTPDSRKRAVGEACSAVESVMRVLLTEHGFTLPKPANVSRLSEDLIEHGLVEGEFKEMLVAPGYFGNRKGRHGGGYVAHEVEEATAEALVASAAVAINYLAKRFPDACSRI